MPVSAKERAQAQLVLDKLDGAAAYPASERWDDDDVPEVNYLYRRNTILTLEQDVERVVSAIDAILRQRGYEDVPDNEREIQHEHVRGTGRVSRLKLPHRTKRTVPEILDFLDRDPSIREGTAKPEHVLYLCPNICAATEPSPEPPDTEPVPPPVANAREHRLHLGASRRECDGAGVTIAIMDTGLTHRAAEDHRWLAGVDGMRDPLTDDHGIIYIPYDAGHGTFVAGVARCMAPEATVYVERAFDYVGANFETDLVGPHLEDALSRNPDILEFTFCATTRKDLSLMTFDDVFETRIRFLKGLVVLAPAGNDGKTRRTWPAAYREVISVGALSANWRERAWFSNYGKWVDVFAPGEDLINAFPSGRYDYIEPPAREPRDFRGMAKWSGTSFSTPLVAGMIAARMSATGENARQAADALLQLADSQAVPGIGAVLYPGQACHEVGGRR
jgi:hypothetical protein